MCARNGCPMYKRCNVAACPTSMAEKIAFGAAANHFLLFVYWLLVHLLVFPLGNWIGELILQMIAKFTFQSQWQPHLIAPTGLDNDRVHWRAFQPSDLSFHFLFLLTPEWTDLLRSQAVAFKLLIAHTSDCVPNELVLVSVRLRLRT